MIVIITVKRKNVTELNINLYMTKCATHIYTNQATLITHACVLHMWYTCDTHVAYIYVGQTLAWCIGPTWVSHNIDIVYVPWFFWFAPISRQTMQNKSLSCFIVFQKRQVDKYVVDNIQASIFNISNEFTENQHISCV